MVFTHDTDFALQSAVTLANSGLDPDTLTTVADLDRLWDSYEYTGRHDRTRAELDAVRALRKIGDASIAGDLVALLNLNNDTVRNELMSTLGAMRHRGAVPELTRIVEQATRTDTPRVVALAADPL